MFFAALLFLNLWAGAILAWLYRYYGLESAIGHGLFYLVWWPFDLHFYRRTGQEAAAHSNAGQNMAAQRT
jgi:hypothetical protein